MSRSAGVRAQAQDGGGQRRVIGREAGEDGEEVGDGGGGHSAVLGRQGEGYGPRDGGIGVAVGVMCLRVRVLERWRVRGVLVLNLKRGRHRAIIVEVSRMTWGSCCF